MSDLEILLSQIIFLSADLRVQLWPNFPRNADLKTDNVARYSLPQF